MQGNLLSRKGLCAIVAAAYIKRDVPFEIALKAYESAMEGFIAPPLAEASAQDEVAQEPRETLCEERREFVPEKVAAEIAVGAALPLFEMLRCKVRYFSHGLALGPAAFVRGIVDALTPTKDTSRRCACCGDVDLHTARWLRGEDKVSVPRGKVA